MQIFFELFWYKAFVHSKLKLLITQFPGGFRLNSANENKPRIGIQMESSWCVKKSNGFNNQNNNVHVQYTSFSLPSLFDYDVKIPNVTFYREYNQVNDEILFPFLNLNMVLRNSTPREFAYI